MRVLRDAGVPALVAALAAGCAGDAPDAADAEAALARAPEATAAAENAAVTLSGTMTIEGLGDRVDFGGEGVVDLDDKRSRVDIDMSEMASFQTPTPGDPDDWRGTIISTPQGTLMKLPAFNALTPEPGKWIRWTGESLVREGGTQFSAPDPVEFLRFVRALGEDVDVVGTDEVGGVETTHLRGDVALPDLPAAAPEAERREAQAYAQRLEAAGLDSIGLDVWLDDEHRIRRLTATYDDIRVASKRVDLLARMELSNFGGAGEVQIPPSNEIVDIGDVIGRGPEETEHSEG
jgi:hypothetical protein